MLYRVRFDDDTLVRIEAPDPPAARERVRELFGRAPFTLKELDPADPETIEAKAIVSAGRPAMLYRVRFEDHTQVRIEAADLAAAREQVRRLFGPEPFALEELDPLDPDMVEAETLLAEGRSETVRAR